MRSILRFLAIVSCFAIIALSLWLQRETGGRVFTRYPSPELERMRIDQIKRAVVLPDAPAEDPVDNEFGLGLLPSGPGRELISVATLAGPAVLALLGLFFPVRRR